MRHRQMPDAAKGASVSEGEKARDRGPDLRGVLVTCVCILLGLTIAFLLALQIPLWIDEVRERVAPHESSVDAAPEPQPAPHRPVPPRDPSRANAPVRGDAAGAFSTDSYPFDAIRKGEQGRTVAWITVDASGTPTACRIESSSGSDSLDRATCRIALQRMHFDPARDGKGNAIAGGIRLPVKWVLPE